jgi:type IV secretory pathway VirB6-like protein
MNKWLLCLIFICTTLISGGAAFAQSCEFQILQRDYFRNSCEGILEENNFVTRLTPETMQDTYGGFGGRCHASGASQPHCASPPQCSPALVTEETTDTVNAIGGLNGVFVFRIFSYGICNVQSILEEVVSEMWCSISEAMRDPLTTLLVLYVTVIAVMFMFGIIQASRGQLLIQTIKIALVWAFVTEGDLAINLGYNFFMAAMEAGISVVSNIATDGVGDETSITITTRLDTMFSQIFLSERPYDVNRQNLSLLTGAAALISGHPIGGAIGTFLIVTVVYSIFVFLKAAVAYLLSIVGIAFLTAMGPLFISLALFQSTKHIFDRWLTALMSFVLQPIILFAFLAFMHAHMSDALDFIACFIQDRVVEVEQPRNAQGGIVYNSSNVLFFFNDGQFRILRDPCTCTFYSKNADWSESVEMMQQLLVPLIAAILMMIMTNAFLVQLPSFARRITGTVLPVLASGSGRDAGGYAARMTGLAGADMAMTQMMQNPSAYVRTGPDGRIDYDFMQQQITQEIRREAIEDAMGMGSNPEKNTDHGGIQISLTGNSMDRESTVDTINRPNTPGTVNPPIPRP